MKKSKLNSEKMSIEQCFWVIRNKQRHISILLPPDYRLSRCHRLDLDTVHNRYVWTHTIHPVDLHSPYIYMRRAYIEMDCVTVYHRIVSTMFEDAMVNAGRLDYSTCFSSFLTPPLTQLTQWYSQHN
jgi:hypothetical protein